MPYKAFREGDGWQVYSLNADGSKKNPHGYHSSEKQANKQVEAMYASGADKKEMDSPDMSGWGLTPDQAQQIGTLLTLFNGKVHESFTCVTDQLSMRGLLSEADVKVFTDLKGQMLKVFNSQCPPELAGRAIPSDILNAIADKEYREEASQLITIKEADLPYDWIMLTSSSFEDREGETVTQKAHAQDIAWMEQHNNYGTLDWFHLHPVVFEYLESKEAVSQLPPYIQEHGLILGDCTMSAMYKHLRIEAGTYRSPQIKSVMDAHKDELSASLLFFRPKNEPIDGAYHNIHTVSRAIMPRNKVSNLAPYLQGVI